MILRGVEPIEIAFIVPVLLFSLSVHEFAHAFTALMLGDVSQKTEGRLTLNPLSHIDWMGFACLVFAGFGWAKPVSVNPANFAKRPKDGITKPRGMKSGMALTSLMGPLSNFTLAFFSVCAFYVLFRRYFEFEEFSMFQLQFGAFILPGESEAVSGFTLLLSYDMPVLPRFIMCVLYQLIIYNLILGAFNLIPLPPMDGSKIFSAFLPDVRYFRFINGGKLTTVILLILIFTGAFGYIISPVIIAGYMAMLFAASSMLSVFL